jgi:micrococcal nuclease
MGWNPFAKKEKSPDDWTLAVPSQEQLPTVVRDYVEMVPHKHVRDKWTRDLFVSMKELNESHPLLLVGTISLTSFVVGFKAGRFQNPWRRFTSLTDIPSQYFGDTAPYLRGRVVSVSDGDTIRFRHTPSFFFQQSTLQEGEKVSSVALPIRICTIDTPETAKFGKEGQPFGEDAKTYLSDMIENKIVYCQLLQQDQYGRAVAQVKKYGILPFWPPSYMDEMMLQAGLAEVYLGGGAVYGHKGKEEYLKMMERAKSKKKGIWSQGEKGESAAEYKARVKLTTK